MKKSLIILVLIIISATVMYYLSGLPQPEITTCTQEAFICADGSTVHRTGKKCEFAACPAVTRTPTATSSPSLAP